MRSFKFIFGQTHHMLKILVAKKVEMHSIQSITRLAISHVLCIRASNLICENDHLHEIRDASHGNFF